MGPSLPPSGNEDALSALLKVVADPQASAKALADLKAAREEAAAKLEELHAATAVHDRREQALDQRETELDAHKDAIAPRIEAVAQRETQLADEREKFSGLKADQDAANQAASEELTKREAAVGAREQAASDREKALSEREAQAQAKLAESQTAIDKLRAIVGSK